MGKSYQHRENNNQLDNTRQALTTHAEEASLEGDVSELLSTIHKETTTPVPVIPQSQKVTMLPIESELTALVRDINPKQPVQPRWQYTLFNMMKSILETQDNAEFHQQWSALLNFYHAAKGSAFSDMYILRFSDEWPGSDSEFSMFRRLVHIVSQTSDPQTRRKSATMINFSRATEGLGEDAGNRLIGFYA